MVVLGGLAVSYARGTPVRGWDAPSQSQLFIVHRQSPLGPVDPSFRALSGRVEFLVRRHKFNKDCLLSQLFIHVFWLLECCLVEVGNVVAAGAGRPTARWQRWLVQEREIVPRFIVRRRPFKIPVRG